MHILVIDDDDRLRLLLKQYLSKNKFKVSTCPNIEKANILLQEFSFDIIILDVMMPGKTGIDFLLEKDNNIKTPVLLLTALDQITDKIKGLKVFLSNLNLKDERTSQRYSLLLWGQYLVRSASLRQRL